jgi:hypothetical protein
MAEFIIVEFDLVPELFHGSHVFQSRTMMKNSDKIVLQNHACNFELKMNNYKELCSALETLRYWNFAKTPECFYYMVLAKKTIIREIILENEYDMMLRFQTFRTFAETCVLTILGRNEMIQVATQLGLTQLASFVSTLV